METITLIILQVVWMSFALIVSGIVHMIIVKKNILSFFNHPIDFGLQVNNKPLFGKNKTWRGVLVLLFLPIFIGGLQGILLGDWASLHELECIDYASLIVLDGVNPYFSGYAFVNLILGLGYIIGELPNSFIKRQIDIAPGKHGKGFLGLFFMTFDHFDSVLFAMLLVVYFFNLNWITFFIALIVLSLIHYIFVGLLYLSKIKHSM